MNKINVSAVSYLNTLPFIYGINQSEIVNQIDLQLDMPSDCARKLLNNEVTIGLVPVAVIPQLSEYHILSDYCIGAKGKVNSVLLLSDVPLSEIEEVLLDYQSKTSVNLVQILARKYWGINPSFIQSELGYEDKIKGKTAGVVIGDRTFRLKRTYKHVYDLSEEWYSFTELPFVFACWVSNMQLGDKFKRRFNEALKLGVNSIDKVVGKFEEGKVSRSELKFYLEKNIDYRLDEDKMKAIQLFHEHLTQNSIL